MFWQLRALPNYPVSRKFATPPSFFQQFYDNRLIWQERILIKNGLSIRSITFPDKSYHANYVVLFWLKIITDLYKKSVIHFDEWSF